MRRSLTDESLAASTLEKFRLAQTHDHEGNDSQKDPAVNPRYVEGELKAAQHPGVSTKNVVTKAVMRQIQENKEREDDGSEAFDQIWNRLQEADWPIWD